MKKAQSIAINTLAIMIIALVVIIFVILIFSGTLSKGSYATQQITNPAINQTENISNIIRNLSS